MADYNLGRATGEIRITADTRGAAQAQAAMASTAAEAKALDAAMGRVNRQFDDNRKVTIASAEDIIRARGEVEELRRAYQRQQQEYVQGQSRVDEAARHARDVLRDQRDDLNALKEANAGLSRAEEDAERLRRRAADSYERYQARLISVRQEVDRFNEAHLKASSGFRSMSREAEKFGEALESITEKLSAVVRIMGQAGLFGLFGGAAAGQLFASGAGAINLLAVAMGAVVEIAESFVGAIALIPAAVNAAVLSIGPLIVGFHGIGQAISSIGDPVKFIQAIRDLSPAAQQAMLTIQSFTSAFRGARDQIQESLFAPMLADIEPLVQTWLPQLMRAGQAIANEWGQAFHQIFQLFQTPQIQQGFKSFVDNLVTGFQAARGAIEPLLQAWNTLAGVGSQTFQRLGAAVTHVAEVFNNWIQRSAQSGELLAFINKALDNFTLMGHTIRDLGIAIHNVFAIFHSDGSSSLETIANISAEFRNWTQSMQGQQSIANFFNLIKAAAQAVQPQIHLLGEAIAVISSTLTRLGIAIQPGIGSFFNSFVEALRNLSPYIIQLAPAINQFLAAFGDTLGQIVDTLGPRLPQFFEDMSDAFVQIMQVLPPLVEVFAEFLGHLTPGEVEVLLGLVVALKLLGATLPAIKAGMIALNIVMDANPVSLLILAIAGLVAAGVLLYENWDTVKEKVGEVTSKFGGMHGILETVKRLWDNLTEAVARFWHTLAGQVSGGWSAMLEKLTQLKNNITGFFSDLWNGAFDWGKNIIQKLIDGMMFMLGPVGTVAASIAGAIDDHLHGRSPTKKGPLSDESPDVWGARLVTKYAEGMSSAKGNVDAASSGVAGSASGIAPGSGSFTSAGISGTSGKGTSGFDQWIGFVTRDLTAWNNIFQEAFGLVTSISDIVTNTVKVVASIWGGGNNPLTQPGGIAGPPQAAHQRQVPGVPNKPIPGVAPIPELAPLGGGPTVEQQQQVPGVPNKPIPGTGSVTATTQPFAAGGVGVAPAPGAPAAQPPASVTGAAPGDTPLVSALKGKGFSDKQIRLIQGFSQVEGNNPAGVPTLGWTDSQLGGDASLQGHVDALAQQFKDRAGVAGAFPEGGSDQEQAQWIANVVGQAGSPSDWQGNAQPQDYVQRVIAAMQGVQAAPAPVSAPSAGTPTRGQLRPGVLQGGAEQGLKPAAQNIASIIETLFPQIQTIGGVHADSLPYHPSGHALDIMLPGDPQSPENIALGNQINDFLRANADKLGIYDTIFRSQYYATGQPPKPYNASSNDPNQRHETHIHTTTEGFPGEGVPEPNFETDITKLKNLPPSFSPNATAAAAGLPTTFRGSGQVTGSGIHLPSDAGTYAIGALAGLGGLAVLARMGSAARLKWLQFNYDRLDAKAKADVLNSLSPQERALIGRNPEIAFGPIDAQSPTVRGLIADVGGTPPEPGSTAATTGPRALPGAVGERGDAALRNLVRSGRMTPGQAAAINPNLLIDVYHATDDARAASILDQGFQQQPGMKGDAYFSPDVRNARVNQRFYGPNVLQGRIPVSAADPDFAGGVRVPFENLQGVQFRRLPPSELGVTDLINTGRGAAVTGVAPANPPRTISGAEAASVVGDAGASIASRAAGVLGRYAPLIGPGSAEDVLPTDPRGNIIGPTTLQRSIGEAKAAITPVVPSIIASGSTLTGQESDITPGVVYGPDGKVIGFSNQPGLGQGPRPGAQRERRGASPIGAAPGSTPVHVTNAEQLPGGTQSPSTRPVTPTSADRPLGAPKPGEPGFIGPVSQRPRTVTGDQGPQPGAQAERRGQHTDMPTPGGIAASAGAPFTGDTTGIGAGAQGVKPDNRSPLDKFTDTMASVGSIAGDAFTVFQDVIESIGAAANITDTLVRGFENTEDVVGFIQQFQTFIKTAADVAKLVGDVGGAIGGAGAGDPTGMTGAIGGAISAISGLVESALTAVNAGISLGIDVYHEVGKYAGYIFGEFLGGPGTGPLGGNVRMLLNTRTNELYTYGEDNPMNKNTFQIPRWQQSYTHQPLAPNLPPQINIYTGPGQTPQGMMQESMWMISTGSAPVASVAGHD